MKKINAILISILMLFLFSCSENKSTRNNDELEIHCINVGQGDCTLIIAPNGKNILIDAGIWGKGAGEVVPYLESIGVDSIQYFVATHFDADHIEGVDEVFNRIALSRHAYDHGYHEISDTTSNAYRQYYNAVGHRETISAGDFIEIDDAILVRCVAANGNGYPVRSENDLSVCLVVTYKNFDFFIGGDISGSSSGDHYDIESIIADDIGSVEVYHVSHHGSRFSSETYMLSVLQPIVSVISTGKNNYGHPHPDVIARLETIGSVWYQTAADDDDSESGETIVDDDIVITSSGNKFVVNTARFTDVQYSVH